MAASDSLCEADTTLNDENAPFLSIPPDQCSEIRQEEYMDADSNIPESTRRRLLITLVFILLAIETGGQMIPGPMVRVIESIACDSYWHVNSPEKLPRNGPIPEHWCNMPAVQTEVANVKGYSDLFEGLLSTLCAIPYGHFADRHGRRISIRLTIPGFVLNGLITISVLWFHGVFPLRTVWLASCSWIIGGGPTVALAIIWTMLADLMGDSDRAVLFFRVGLASQIAGFVASAVSSGLMAINPWIPLLVGCGTVMLGLTAVWCLPETINLVKKESGGSISGSESGRQGQDHTMRREENWSPKYTPLRKVRRFLQPYLFIFTPRLLTLLFSFMLYQIALGSSSFLTQYISTRFNWTLAKAQLLLSLHSLITIPVFAFLIPHLTNRTFGLLFPPRKDLYIATLSIISLALGSLGIGLSPAIFLTVPSLCIHALGAGFPLAMRSLVTAFVERDETAKLYAVVEVVQSLGSMLGSLVVTNAFEVGLGMGGGHVGLAYVLSGILFGAISGALGFVKV